MDFRGQTGYGDLSGDGGVWRVYPSGKEINLMFSKEQNVAADVYPITINFAKYED